jgi:hypothetical protein
MSKKDIIIKEKEENIQKEDGLIKKGDSLDNIETLSILGSVQLNPMEFIKENIVLKQKVETLEKENSEYAKLLRESVKMQGKEILLLRERNMMISKENLVLKDGNVEIMKKNVELKKQVEILQRENKMLKQKVEIIEKKFKKFEDNIKKQHKMKLLGEFALSVEKAIVCYIIGNKKRETMKITISNLLKKKLVDKQEKRWNTSIKKLWDSKGNSLKMTINDLKELRFTGGVTHPKKNFNMSKVTEKHLFVYLKEIWGNEKDFNLYMNDIKDLVKLRKSITKDDLLDY